MTDNNILSQSLKDINYPLAYGNRKSIVNGGLYSGENFNKKSLVFSLPQIEDRIRARTSAYWFGNELFFKHISSEKHPFNISVIQKEFVETPNNIWGQFEELIELKANKQLFHFDLVIPPNKTSTYNAEAWKKCITNETTPDLSRAREDPSFPSQAEERIENNTSLEESERNRRTLAVDIGQGSSPQVPRQASNTPVISSTPTQQLQASFQQPEFNIGQTTPGQSVLENQGNVRQIELIKPSFQRGKVYDDFIFELATPIRSSIYNFVSFPVGTKLFDVKPEYNFFVEDYEKVIGNVHETLLPNLYSFLSEMKAENRDSHKTIFSSHISLFGNIENVFIDVLNERGQKINEKDKGEYFEKYAKNINNFLLNDETNKNLLINKFKHQVFPETAIELIKDFSNKKLQYPMNFEVSFSTDKQTQLAQVIKDSALFSSITSRIIGNSIKSNNVKIREITETLEQKNNILNKSYTAIDNNINTWNISQLILDMLDNKLTEDQVGIFFGINSKEINNLNNFSSQFVKQLSIYIFSGKLKAILKEKFRSYYDIINGKKCFAETLFYRIDKLDASTKEVLQSFYIPNTGELNVIRLVDTQVKYNKEYTYRIHSYQLVLGNRYKYDLIEVSQDKAKLKVINEPQVLLAEVLYGEETNVVVDDPPIFPNVEFIPYRGVDNKIRLFFTNNFDQIDDIPVIIDESDEENFKNITKKQKKSFGEKIHFGTDDVISTFQVYRTSSPPSSYKDFAGKQIKNVETDVSLLTFQKAGSATFIDNILPNKKYYYMFRSIDVHGHLSNPSSVFELEMVNDGFSVFPVLKSYQFPTQDIVYSKSCKRFIQITPAFNQTILNEEKSGFVVNGKRVDSIVGQQNIHLGISEQQVWNKTFKIRITSKKSGKKLDLNVSFVHNSVKE